MEPFLQIGDQYFITIQDITFDEIQWIVEEANPPHGPIHFGAMHSETIHDGLGTLNICINVAKSKDTRAALDLIMMLKLKYT